MGDAFDPFAQEAEKKPTTSDPWLTTNDWAREPDFAHVHAANDGALDTSFESAAFEFSVTEGDFEEDLFDPVFPNDAMATEQNGHDADPFRTTVHVTLHEQLTSLYDGSSELPSSHLEGSIHVRSSDEEPFSIVVRDTSQHIGSIQLDDTICQEITPKASDLFYDVANRVFRVKLDSRESAKKRRIISYTGSRRLGPIPLLVKSKVQIAANRCRVGIKIRSNPERTRPMTQMVVIMAVPPNVKGETAKLSRKGGIWDGMKRVVAWNVGVVEPGNLIEIQAQFDCLGEVDHSPKFPILVRCDAENDQFSQVELNTDSLDEHSSAVRMEVTRSTRILHRKV